MKKLNTIKLVEELTQEQLNTLKELIFWNKTNNLADYSNLNTEEKQEIDYALFESDISNKIVYKLFRDIYFTDKALEKIKEVA